MPPFFGAGGEWEHALLLLSSLEDLTVKANEIAYNAAISACPWMAEETTQAMLENWLRNLGVFCTLS